MTDENTLLSENNTPTAVDQLVGPGKKFATVEDLVRGKLEADRFIETLKAEQAGLREDLNQRVRLEELLERLEESRSDGTNSNGINQNQSERPNDPNIETLIEQTLTKREQQKTASENVNEVRNALKKHFGENWEAKLQAKAEENKVTVAELNDLAKRSPSLFLKAIGVSEAPGSTYTAPTGSSQFSSDRMGSNTPVGGKRDWNHYEALRKANPSEYWSPATQLRMHNDAIAAANRGEDFGNK